MDTRWRWERPWRHSGCLPSKRRQCSDVGSENENRPLSAGLCVRLAAIVCQRCFVDVCLCVKISIISHFRDCARPLAVFIQLLPDTLLLFSVCMYVCVCVILVISLFVFVLIGSFEDSHNRNAPMATKMEAVVAMRRWSHYPTLADWAPPLKLPT